MKKTFSSFCFGCRVNQAEKEQLDRELELHGLIQDENKPSFYIINTCAVTQKAEREARQLIYQIRRKFPKTKIVVTGCAATKWLSEKSKMPSIDYLIANSDKRRITNMINKFVSDEIIKKYGLVKQSSQPLVFEDKFLNSGRLLVKIQDGCQRFCTYCIVPYLRGRLKSRKIKEIIEQINNEKNIQEVILTAINTEAFGLDTGESLTELLAATLSETHVPRVSLGSINPWSIDDKFYNFYKKYNLAGRLVNFFHIPLQSGSNKILELMNRGYTREEFEEKIKRIHDINPMALIATDVIVGFLDEDEKDFKDTYNFLERSPIYKFHIFRYSPREKTAAYFMSKNHKNIDEVTKVRRAKILSDLGKKKYNSFLEKHVGKTFPALFLVRKKESYQEILLDNQIPAWIKTSKDLPREIHSVKITHLRDCLLFGILA